MGRDLPKEEWLRFFEELDSCAVTNVVLGGGEAFYQADLRELIEGIVCNRMRFSVLSNGTLVTDEMGAFLASTGRCDSVQISIDGSTPVAHDTFRGAGNFVRAVEGIKTLQKYRVSVSVRVTIHRKNVEDLEGVAHLLLEELGLSGFSTNAASHLGLCRQNVDEVQLTFEERSLAMETLLKLSRKYNGRVGATAGPLSEARDWLEMEKARQEGKEGIPGRGYLVSCGGVFSKLAVRADGVVVPCNQMGHIELGRINQEDLREIWHDHPELKKLRERRSIPLSDFEFCNGCDYINYCAGGCPALACTMVGEVNHPSPDSCLKSFLVAGGRLPDELTSS